MLTKELIGKIAESTGQSKKSTEQLLNAFNAVVRETLVAGTSVQLQNFGVLEVKNKNERTIVHPRTGERTIIPRKNQLVFKPVNNVKEALKNI